MIAGLIIFAINIIIRTRKLIKALKYIKITVLEPFNVKLVNKGDDLY